MFDFNNKIAVVTGAADTLGEAVAEAFHVPGAKLVLIDLAQDKL
jgi:NAD(P)-dependent dehydrogenase (short-subunit alcohol dehydrogenase family)